MSMRLAQLTQSLTSCSTQMYWLHLLHTVLVLRSRERVQNRHRRGFLCVISAADVSPLSGLFLVYVSISAFFFLTNAALWAPEMNTVILYYSDITSQKALELSLSGVNCLKRLDMQYCTPFTRITNIGSKHPNNEKKMFILPPAADKLLATSLRFCVYISRIWLLVKKTTIVFYLFYYRNTQKRSQYY